jgi:MFS family permease
MLVCTYYIFNSINIFLSKDEGKFDWNKKTQGIILASFYIGYILTQLPGGLLAGKCGGKHLFGWSMLFCSASTITTPFAARTSVPLLIAVRAFAGLCQVNLSIILFRTVVAFSEPKHIS